jgi:membrane protease YdiL (CAAX protease family)
LAILRNPLSRILLYMLMVVAITWAMNRFLPETPYKAEELVGLPAGSSILWLYSLKTLVPVVLPYWLLALWIERRKIDEMAPRKMLPGFLAGALVGTAVLIVAVLAMALFGAYTIKGVNSGVSWMAPLLVMGLLPGITEEIMFRGVLFRVTEDGLGTWIALILSACFFGAVHLGNPNATWWSSAAIAIEAGLLLGMAYAWTRSLWFVMGLHAAWNFTQGPLLGIPVSGIAFKGLLDSSTQGPVWLSGGEFGAEASATTVLICLLLAAFFTHRAIKRSGIRPPFWRRKKELDAAPSTDTARPDVAPPGGLRD